MRLDEAAFRALLDRRGLLAGGPAEAPFPTRDGAFTVFAQRPDARIDGAEWKRHAERFFGTRLGLTVDKDYEEGFPAVDAARVVLAPGGIRVCWGRPRTDDDLRAAAKAEAAGAGLDELAKRCPQVWLIETETETDEDVVALRLAGILAGVLLGPILTPRGVSLFGPKTARQRLDAS